MRWFALASLAPLAFLALGVAAGEEKPLTLRIAPQSGLYLSMPVKALWEGTLGKEIRGLFEREIHDQLKEIRDATTFGPSDIERLTVVADDMTRLQGNDVRIVTLIRFARALKNDGVMAQILPDARSEKIHGQRVFVRAEDGVAGFVSRDGLTMAFGPRKSLESLLDPATPAIKGRLAEAVAASKEDKLVLFARPRDAQDTARELTAYLPAARTVLASQGLLVQAQIGTESTFSARFDFEDDKAASRGYKALNGLRALTTLSLSGGRESIAGKSASFKTLLSRIETSLEAATLEHKRTQVHFDMKLTLNQAERLAMFKDLLVPVKNAARAVRSQNNLKQIGLAMHAHNEVRGTFPAVATYDKDGKALLSWRVHLLPYLGQATLYKQFKLDEPWDSPHNKKLIAKMPEVYAVPTTVAAKPGETFYQVFHGKQTAFEGKRGRNIANFGDGTSNTFLVVEAAKAVPWTKPDDVPFDPEGKMMPFVGGHFEGGFHVVMGDGSVRFFKSTLSEAILKLYIQPDDGMVIPNHD